MEVEESERVQSGAGGHRVRIALPRFQRDPGLTSLVHMFPPPAAKQHKVTIKPCFYSLQHGQLNFCISKLQHPSHIRPLPAKSVRNHGPITAPIPQTQHYHLNCNSTMQSSTKPLVPRRKNLLLCLDAFGTLFTPSTPIPIAYARAAARHGLAVGDTEKPDALSKHFKQQFALQSR